MLGGRNGLGRSMVAALEELGTRKPRKAIQISADRTGRDSSYRLLATIDFVVTSSNLDETDPCNRQVEFAGILTRTGWANTRSREIGRARRRDFPLRASPATIDEYIYWVEFAGHFIVGIRQ
jgi:hypothetical protein